MGQPDPVVEVAAAPPPMVIYRDGLLRLPEVSRLTGLGRSAIYERMGLGAFPLPRNLGGNAVAWPAGEVLDWIKALPQVSIRQAKPRS